LVTEQETKLNEEENKREVFWNTSF